MLYLCTLGVTPLINSNKNNNNNINRKDNMDKLSYALGLGIGTQLAQLGAQDINLNDFTQAVKDMLEGKGSQLPQDEAQKIVNEFFQKQEEREMERRREAGKAAKEAGEKYLAENAKNPNVIQTPSGLQYEVLVQGTGKQPKATDTVKVHYEGRLIDGQIFDSSIKRGEPICFPLNQVIAGWTEGVQLMSEGSKYRFHIPYNLAYGEAGAGAGIPPYAALIFDVELIEVM